jgi:hypothetical protein
LAQADAIIASAVMVGNASKEVRALTLPPKMDAKAQSLERIRPKLVFALLVALQLRFDRLPPR